VNPNDQNLYPDAAQRIMMLVKNTFGDLFTYFLGLPDNFAPPNDAFPLIIVDKAAGTYKVGPTTADDITEHVYVHIMVDVKTGFGAPDTDNVVKRQLQTLVEGRDPVTGYLLPNSLMYALRTHLTLSSASVPGLVTINNEINISYDAIERPNLPETREAVIDITISERQMVPNRN
jgi:hypothetical protein